MNRIQFLKIAGICCPILAAVVGGSAVAWEKRRENHLQAQYATLNREAKSLEQTIKEMSGLTASQRFAAVSGSPQEQPEFLKQLHGYADTHHVQLVRWTDTPDEVKLTAVTNGKAPRAPGISAIVSQLVAQGTYNDTRLFLYDLVRSPRLLTLNDIKCAHSEQGLTVLNFSLTRYINGLPVPEKKQ